MYLSADIFLAQPDAAEDECLPLQQVGNNSQEQCELPVLEELSPLRLIMNTWQY